MRKSGLLKGNESVCLTRVQEGQVSYSRTVITNVLLNDNDNEFNSRINDNERLARVQGGKCLAQG